jgi:hypothetical protein
MIEVRQGSLFSLLPRPAVGGFSGDVRPVGPRMPGLEWLDRSLPTLD